MILKLSTTTKIKIARALKRAVVATRSALGRPPTHFVGTRGGIRWNLDLDQGIDLAIFLFGRFEPTTARLINSLIGHGMVALDIGANIGAHALPMAKAVGPTGRVYAIEPTEWAYQRMAANRALNPSLEQSLVMLHALVGAPGASAPETFFSSWSLTSSADSHPSTAARPARLAPRR